MGAFFLSAAVARAARPFNILFLPLALFSSPAPTSANIKISLDESLRQPLPTTSLTATSTRLRRVFMN